MLLEFEIFLTVANENAPKKSSKYSGYFFGSAYCVVSYRIVSKSAKLQLVPGNTIKKTYLASSAWY